MSAVEITACWDVLDLDLPPARLTRMGPGHGFDQQKRRAALAALDRRGLCDGQRPRRELAEMLRLVGQADYRVDLCWGSRGNGVIEAVGAVAGSRGVVVADVEGHFTLAAPDGSRVPGLLLEMLGPIKAGVGRAVNIPADLLDAAVKAARTGGLWDVADELGARGVARLDASSLVHMCQGMCGRGQIGATSLADGRARRAPWVVGMHLTASGWFAQIRRAGTATIRPVNAHELLRHWDKLIEYCRP